MRALVIDDSRTMRRIISRILADLGFETIEAEHGREALDVLESGVPVDLACVDWNMPVMDGLDAIAAIRRHEEEAGVAPLPIMVLSADSQEKTRHTLLAHGANGFVTKPLDPEALVLAVQEHTAA